VFGRIDGSVSFDALKVDMDMETVVTETKNGKLTYTFKKA